MNPPDTDYFLEIESHFAHRRETAFVFSARDWALMKSWHQEGIPLPVVIEAIDACFEKRAGSGRKRTISSLSYCRHAVHDLWEERKQLHVGAAESVPEVDAAASLQRLEAEIREAAAARPPAVAAILEEGAREVASLSARSVPEIEAGLAGIEAAMYERLIGAIDAGERLRIETSVDEELARYPKLDPAIRDRTREANVRRLLRASVALPRLSLFS